MKRAFKLVLQKEENVFYSVLHFGITSYYSIGKETIREKNNFAEFLQGPFALFDTISHLEFFYILAIKNLSFRYEDKFFKSLKVLLCEFKKSRERELWYLREIYRTDNQCYKPAKIINNGVHQKVPGTIYADIVKPIEILDWKPNNFYD